MLSIFLIILSIIVLIIVIIYIILTLTLYKAPGGVPTKIEFKPIDIDSLVNSENEYFATYHQELITLGFVSPQASILKLPDSVGHFIIYTHKSKALWAMVTEIESGFEQLSYIEVCQGYNDGSFLTVNNAKAINPYPKMKSLQKLSFPSITHMDELISIHQSIASKLKSGITAKPIDPDKSLDYVSQYLANESDMLLAKGLVKPTIDENGMRSVTFKGAFIMLLRFIPPTKKYYQWQQQREAKQVLN